MNRVRFLTLIAATIAAPWFVSTPVDAQDNFPTKPIRIVMPVPVGSALDVVIRAVGNELTTRLGQQIVIENRPGAGGILAARAVAAAPPDGYTLLGGAASVFTILPAQQEKLPIDVNRDLVQIGMISRSAMLLAVPSHLGVSSLAEFIAKAKAQPEQIVVGSTGAGTLPHLAGLALTKRGGVPITLLPYATGGTAEAINDILGRRVHAVIEALPGLRGWVQSGDLRIIATMGHTRDPLLPDVPAIGEALPGLSAVGFMTLAAPAGTPGLIVERLNNALADVLAAPAIRQRYAEFGIDPKSMTPVETRAFVDQEQKHWWPLVRELGVN
jgi:tripartite-type tricarboxylate transporter receptor subunit TctC